MDGSEDCYYFCHICNHHRVREEVLQRASGDLVCMVCDNEGFVEKVGVVLGKCVIVLMQHSVA